MRRHFGRRRRTPENSRPALDAGRELSRLLQTGAVPVDSLAPVGDDEVPAGLAVVGLGSAADGTRLVVAVAPDSGGDAWLAGVAVAARLVEAEDFSGRVLVFSRHWSTAARRRLAWLRNARFRVEAYIDPSAGTPTPVAPEAAPAPLPLTTEQAAAAGATAELRERYALAARALAGLAAKHGGAWQPGWPESRLLLMGRPVGVLRASGAGLEVETLEPRRDRRGLGPTELVDVLDRLEGSLRKFLSDRKTRDGESGERAARAERLRSALAVRDAVRWPAPGADWVGVDADGRPVVAAAPEILSLETLGPVLDAYAQLGPRLAAHLALAAPPVRTDDPRLALAYEQLVPAAQRVLASLDLDCELVDLRDGRRTRPALALSTSPPVAPPRPEPQRPVPPRAEPPRDEEDYAVAAPAAPAVPAAAVSAEVEPAPATRRFEEMSLFDLGEEDTRREGGEGGQQRRRRRRGRGRGVGDEGRRPSNNEGRRPAGDDGRRPSNNEGGRPRLDEAGGRASGEGSVEAPADSRDDTDAERFDEREPRRGRRGRGRGRGRRRALMVDSAEQEDADDPVAPLVDDDEPDLDRLEEAPPLPEYEEDDSEDPAPVAEEVGPDPTPTRPRRRAALVVHADRDSIGAAVLLARDLRLVEGLWIYPQEDLMTFFRSVATDLREDTPIYVVGFTASPARDVIQAASLYRERLTWFDHHEWPPEDLEGLRAAIGQDSVHLEAGAGTPMPAVLVEGTRRSRFSDKLLDVLSGRFSAHDWERWGHLWWWRLGDLATRPGERRNEIEALLSGRPSDLAREAAKATAPPTPEEAAYVAGRDFPLSYFGGYVLVRVEVPPELDPALTARIARERYGARLSLAWHRGSERVVLDVEDGNARRVLNRTAMVEHLAQKFGWIDALSDKDHVARLRARGLADDPSRIDDLVAEIAMGRSILEG